MGTGAAEHRTPLLQAIERQAQDAILSPERTGLVAGGRRCATQSRKTEDLTYQVLTVAAIVLLLGSLWVF